MKLNEAFQFYMKSSGLAGQPISQKQLIETRRAFVAGITSFVAFLDNYQGTDQDLDKIFSELRTDCIDFWNEEVMEDELQKIQQAAKSINPNNLTN